MNNYLYVAFGGGIGAVLRVAVAGLIQQAAPTLSFPLATFTINVLGCFFAGMIVALSDRLGGIGEHWRHLVMTGLLGGFTTFSAFGVETVELMKRGMPGTAASYAAGSVICGLVSLYLATMLVGRS